MRLRAKRWPEVRGLLTTLTAQIVFSLFASLTASTGSTPLAAEPWTLRITLLAILSGLTLTVGVEAGRCKHKDLAAIATAVASTSQLLYTMVIIS